PKAFLERAGYVPATIDLAVEALDEPSLRQARLIAIAVPMHTALRLGVRAAERVRRVAPARRIVGHGLYRLPHAASPAAPVARAHPSTRVAFSPCRAGACSRTYGAWSRPGGGTSRSAIPTS